MARPTEKQYQRRLMAAMMVYVGTLLLLWPLARTTDSLPLKVLLALLPVLPMLYAVALMVQRVWHSDELQQRTHLVALGVATVVLSTVSLFGGFLAAAGVIMLDGSVLIWVFPALLVCYGLTRWWVARRYGSGENCGDEGGFPPYIQFLLMAVLLAALALYTHLRNHDKGLLVISGMAAAFALAAVVSGLRRWQRQRQGSRHD